MVTSATVVGLVFLLTGSGLVLLLREPIRQPDRPASLWFALAVVGIALWPLSLGVSYLLADRGLSILAWSGRSFAASMISVSWFLLAVEYTTQRRPSRPLLAAAGTYLALDIAVVATNEAHHLVLTEATGQAGTILVPAFGPYFWTRTVLNYGLILLATAILAVEWNGSTGIKRRQSGILAVAVVPPLIANFVTLVAPIPSLYDLTPFGLAGSGILLTWALYRVEFLDVIPVAREAVMEEMRDAVVTLDDERRVVDCNATARELFGAETSYLGTPAEEFFASLPSDVRDRIRTGERFETEVTVEESGEQRHYSLSVSPVRIGEDVAGRVVVLRDVTPIVARERALEERQQELDLLRQVLTRVLRHNLRNALTTIHGNAEFLARDLDGEGEARAERILNTSDDLLTISEKAGHVERIAVDAQPITYDLVRVVEGVLADCRAEYPDVAFESDLLDERLVDAGRGLEVAVEAILENAAEYADPDDPRVTVTVDGEGPTLRVTDNGEGIPDAEVAVLEAREETPLRHGSGIGLWLAKWVADHAGADLSFSGDGSGTTVTMDFGTGRSPVVHDPGSADETRSSGEPRPGDRTPPAAGGSQRSSPDS